MNNKADKTRYGDTATSEKFSNGRMLVLFVDAFAYDYLAIRPFMPGFWQEALPLQTLIGYSSSIVPSLWSGLLPNQMNAWNEFYYKPRRPYRLLRVLERVPHRYARNFLRLVLQRYSGRTGQYRQWLPGIPTRIEHLFSRTTVRYWEFPPVPVGDAGLDARLRAAGLSYKFWFNSHNFSAQAALAQLAEAPLDTQVFVYGTAAMDDAGHEYGPYPLHFDKLIAELEEFITGARTILAKDGDLDVIVISDHGMTEVKKHFNLIRALAPWRLGRDYLAFLDSTMARFWDKGSVPLSQIKERLQNAGVGRFLDQDDIDYYGLRFSDNRYGDEIFVMDPGYLISPSFMEAPPVPHFNHEIKAMHGYHPKSDSSTRGVFLYHGSSPLPHKPHRVTDVAPLIEQILTGQEDQSYMGERATAATSIAGLE